MQLECGWVGLEREWVGEAVVELLRKVVIPWEENVMATATLQSHCVGHTSPYVRAVP